jgi:DNA polymerase IIIc chi subunit
MRRNDAREQWLRLKAQGWKQVDPQWGAEVDV